jgi:hypothetical protein
VVPVENYTLGLWSSCSKNVTNLNYDQSLETVREDLRLGLWGGRSDESVSLLSLVHLLDKRIIPVGKGLVPVSMFAWVSHISGGKKQRRC